jgi:hypothetical protein
LNTKQLEDRYEQGLCAYCDKEHLEYNQFCMKHLAENKKSYYQDALKDIKKIYIAGCHKSTNIRWDAGMWNRFNCYFINKDLELERIFFGQVKDVPHWDNKKFNFRNSVIGSDRVFEIAYGLGMYLFNDGYKFKDEFLSWSE